MIGTEFSVLSAQVLDAYAAAGLRIVTAESCTGGLIAANLTSIAGSSSVFERGFVTYTNDSKMDLLGVPEDILARVGAVSEETAKAMAEGALDAASGDVSVAVTGIAGPGGGTAEKPVGLVYIASAKRGGETVVSREVFSGDRTAVRAATVEKALELLLTRLD